MNSNYAKTMRICCRKLPPTLSEEEFCNIDSIKRYIQQGIIKVKYYPAELIGDTAAPPTSMAMISINADDQTISIFNKMLSQLSFKMHTGESINAQVEYAPCPSLFIKQHPSQPRQLPSIDTDPDFVAFCKTFDESFVPEKDVNLDELIIDDDKIDPNNMLNQMNLKLTGKQQGGNGKGPKNQNPQANPGKKKKKFKKGKKGNQ